jgi:hypothetical protein
MVSSNILFHIPRGGGRFSRRPALHETSIGAVNRPFSALFSNLVPLSLIFQEIVLDDR